MAGKGVELESGLAEAEIDIGAVLDRGATARGTWKSFNTEIHHWRNSNESQELCPDSSLPP